MPAPAHKGLSFNDLVAQWSSVPEHAELSTAKTPYQRAPFYMWRMVGAVLNESRTKLLVLHPIGNIGAHVLTVARDARKINWIIVVNRNKKLFPHISPQQRMKAGKLLSTVLNSDIGPKVRVFCEQTHQQIEMRSTATLWSPTMDQYCLRVKPYPQIHNTHASHIRVRNLVCVLDTTLDLEAFEECIKFLMRSVEALIHMMHDPRSTMTYLTVYTSPPYHTLISKLPLCDARSVLVLGREIQRVRLLEPDPALVANTIVAISSVIRAHQMSSDYLFFCRNEVLSYFKWRASCTKAAQPFPVPVAYLCTHDHAVSLSRVKKLLTLQHTRFGIGPYTWTKAAQKFYGTFIDTSIVEQQKEHETMIGRLTAMIHRRLVNCRVVITLGDQLSVRFPYIAEHEGCFEHWLTSGAPPLNDFENAAYSYGIDVPMPCHSHQFASIKWGSIDANGNVRDVQSDHVFVEDKRMDPPVTNWLRRTLFVKNSEAMVQCATAH